MDDAEQTPLLPQQHHEDQEHCVDVTKSSWFIRKFLAICGLCGLLVVVSEAAILYPVNQLMESIICKDFSKSTDPSMARCKETDVQTELANIIAWKSTVEAFVELSMAIPFTMVVNKYPKSRLLAFTTFGMTLWIVGDAIVCAFPSVIPIRWMIATPFIKIIGGGGEAYNAILYSVISDISTDATRSNRFFLVFGVILLGSFLGTPAAYFLMKVGVWFTVFTAIAIRMFAATVALLIPDIKHESNNAADISPDTSADLTKPTSILGKLRQMGQDVMEVTHWFLYKNRSAGILLVICLLGTIGMYCRTLELQYIAKRFSVEWSEAGIILNSRHLTSLALYFFLLPVGGKVLTDRYHFAPAAKDLLLLQISLGILAIGAVWIGLANTIPLIIFATIFFSAGGGYKLLSQSLLSSLTSQQDTAKLYVVVGAVTNFALIVAGPFVASIFNIGLTWGPEYIGLPYFVVGAMFAFTLLLALFVRVPKSKTQETLADDDGI